MIYLERIKRTDNRILSDMAIHYSAPKGFVGRNICYAIIVNSIYYGAIVGGSATRFLPGRDNFFNWVNEKRLNNIVNNIFYHVERKNGDYPCRNFTSKVISVYVNKIEKDWFDKYGDKVEGHESLVELPRTGQCYKRAGFTVIGETKGYTCKRVAGKGTDSWSGKRVWDTENLRPKLVLAKKVDTNDTKD